MNQIPNTSAFNAVLTKEHANDTKLGMPSTDEAHFARRMTIMERMAGGKGWSSPAREPKKDAQGLTRGDRKRAARERANTAVSETRPYLYMHSAARRRVLAYKIAA